jgi:hypothetical protein
MADKDQDGGKGAKLRVLEFYSGIGGMVSLWSPVYMPERTCASISCDGSSSSDHVSLPRGTASIQRASIQRGKGGREPQCRCLYSTVPFASVARLRDPPHTHPFA